MTPTKFQERALSDALRELANTRNEATELIADLQRKRAIVAAHVNPAAVEDQRILAMIDEHLANARAFIELADIGEATHRWEPRQTDLILEYESFYGERAVFRA